MEELRATINETAFRNAENGYTVLTVRAGRENVTVVGVMPEVAAGEQASEWTSRTYTVEKGDTLSRIAKEMYGDAGKYPAIFEANKPMLKDPDKIYPGQVLRIPAEA